MFSRTAFTDYIQYGGVVGLPDGIGYENVEIDVFPFSPVEDGYLKILYYPSGQHKESVNMEFYFNEEAGKKALKDAQAKADRTDEINGNTVYSYTETLKTRVSFGYNSDVATRLYFWEQDGYVYCAFESYNSEAQLNLCSAKLVSLDELLEMDETADAVTSAEGTAFCCD